MDLSRRAVIAGGLGLAGLVTLFAATSRRVSTLRADPEGRLDLPPRFSYRVLQTAGEPMDDGFVVPGRPDGMGCFEGPDDTLILMRNHEIRDATGIGAFPRGKAPKQAYDPTGQGAVTRLVLGPDGVPRSSNLVLCGTRGNCAGGVSPWGWLSCEEDVESGHGYVFLCDIHAETVQQPRRIDGYGRMNHEAACVDPGSHVAYLTEDRADSCIYRFVPDDSDDPFSGKLYAMVVEGVRDTGPLERGDVHDISWVHVPPQAKGRDALRAVARGLGAAIVRRGEGCWWHDGQVVVSATAGGPRGFGQVLVLDPTASTLSVLADSPHFDRLAMPDNITVHPDGHVVVAEDNGHSNHIRAVKADGTIVDVARNSGSKSEFCGVCFSPDGTKLFANVQKDGLTVVIEGPFAELLAG